MKAAAATTGNKGAWWERETPFGIALGLPAIIILAVTTTFPLISLLWNSFQHLNLTNPQGNGFAGLSNYAKVFSDERFWASLGRSLIYTIATVIQQVVIGLALALMVSKIRRARAIIRVASIMPIMVAPVVVGLVWATLLLTPDYGVVDWMVQALGLGAHNWLGDPTLAFVTAVLMHTWQWTPFAFLVFLATLMSYPTELEEAARLDGANLWQQFRYLLLPFLRPAIVVVIIFRTVVAMSAFDAIYAATGGGPGTATEILNLYAYRVTFSELDIGYGSTLAVILLVVTGLIALAFARLRVAR